MEAYRNPALSPRERAEDLMKRMTLSEKVGQLNQRLYGFRIYERDGENFTLTEEFKKEVEQMGGLGVLYGLYRADPWADKDEKTGITPRLAKKVYNQVQEYVISHSRFGIPVLTSSECPHGHQALGGGLLPVNLAVGASFDPELLREGYRACGRQLRSGHVDLALMSVLDVLRDPRWGRSEECYSEDPYLCSRMAKAAVEGMQSQNVGCVAKHFCAQGETTGGINASAARIGERELREIHFPAAKACCEANVEGIMAAYNEIDGVYCHSNPWLLRTVLREEMGFHGIVMADGVAIDMLKNAEGDTLHAGAAALRAGVDVSLWDEGFSRLCEAVEKDLVEESVLDEAVLRVLEMKFRRGLFEHPFMEEDMESGEEAGITPVSLELSRESAVLLKNQGVLPLEKPHQKIAVIGYHAADRYCMLGDYTPPVPEEECVTVLQGMKKLAPEGTQVEYAMGSGFAERDEEELARAVALVKRSDVIVAVVGGSSSRFGGAVFDTNGAVKKGSTSRTMDCGEGMDLSNLRIPSAQEELIFELAALGKPMVTVVIAGRPYCIGEVEERSDSLLYSFYPGPMGGMAIAEILYGITGPSGRLPASLPKNVGQLPVAYNYSVSSAAVYSDGSAKPLHSFGEGMSYTEFACDQVEIGENDGEGIALSFTLKNTGTRKGTAVPSLYIRRMTGSSVPRVRELKGFQRVCLDPGEEKQIRIFVSGEEMDAVKIPGRAYTPCRNYILMLMDGDREYWSGEIVRNI
ncbi:MAG: glycoside hydrolase family 3 N-terminal domain-containing protein [Lachnospiraceae bacterium]|nr:glycoside hydrolase family 3 N-terminal domain-containing protein [Lachnospiraceae bacterium]